MQQCQFKKKNVEKNVATLVSAECFKIKLYAKKYFSEVKQHMNKMGGTQAHLTVTEK